MNASNKIRIKAEPNAILPKYQTEGSAGMDVYALVPEGTAVLLPGERKQIKTGIFIELPVGYEAQIRPRSGLALKEGITVLNSPGTIDSDYRGEVGIILINHSDKQFTVKNGDRICQMIISKYETIEWDLVENLDETKRNTKGFGHTGV